MVSFAIHSFVVWHNPICLFLLLLTVHLRLSPKHCLCQCLAVFPLWFHLASFWFLLLQFSLGLDSWPVLSWCLCIATGLRFHSTWLPLSNPFSQLCVWKRLTVLWPLCIHGSFAENQLTVNSWMNFWVLYSFYWSVYPPRPTPLLPKASIWLFTTLYCILTLAFDCLCLSKRWALCLGFKIRRSIAACGGL